MKSDFFYCVDSDIFSPPFFVLSSWFSRNTSSISSSAWCSSVRPSGSPSVSTCRCWLITSGGEYLSTQKETTRRRACSIECCSISTRHSGSVTQVHEQACDERSGTVRPDNHHERGRPGVLSKGRLVQTGFLPPLILLLSLWVRMLFFLFFMLRFLCCEHSCFGCTFKRQMCTGL